MRRLWVVLLAVPLLAGCLVKLTTNVLYIEPDGSVTWTVLEENVHSDDADVNSRTTEEEAYLGPALEGEHDVARALRSLEGEEIRGTVLRGTRPYVVFTSARFAGVDVLARRILDQAGIPGEVDFEIDGESRRLIVTIHPGRAEEDAGESNEDACALCDLRSSDSGLGKIRLAEGKFLDAEGFEIVEDGSAAVPLVPSDEEIALLEEEDSSLRLMLTWTTRR